MNTHVGEIPINDYLWYLNLTRNFSKDLAIDYTKDIYDVDLTNLFNEQEYTFLNKTNIYKEFEEKHPRVKLDDGTREYFNAYGRRYFYKFMKYIGNDNEDVFNPFYKNCIVHHIYPLSISNDNDIFNLIYLSDYNHKLLHKNPLEENRKCCFKAVDYLGYIYRNASGIINKYKILNYKDDLELSAKMFKVALETEMDQFYKRMVEEHELVTT